jgi:hypothetical protein
MASIRVRSLATAAMAAALLASPAAAGAAGASSAAAPSWTIQSVPSPADPSGILQSISCPTTTWCMAVGYSYGTKGLSAALSETWNGKAWSVVSVAAPAGATSDQLQAVSCTSTTWCIAVGEETSGTLPVPPLVETWNGKAWSPASGPAPGYNAGLQSVSCVSAGACSAVGWEYTSGATEYPLAEWWNGRTWSVQAAARPSGSASSSLDAVSCASATSCDAVGTDIVTTGGEVPLAESWNGRTWSLQSAPAEPGSATWLSGLSCHAADFCVAVGGYTGGPGGRALVEDWNGSRWSIGVPPLAPELIGVACTSTTACEAVGNTDAAAWNGKVWTAQKLPTGYPSDVLSGISCPSTSLCTSVGTYSPAGNAIALAEHWNGTAWSTEGTKDAWYSGGAGPYAVSCSSSTACAAVAAYPVEVPGFTTESWNGKAWSIDAAQKPANRPPSALEGVSCVSATSCAAVGANSLLEGWNGTSWVIRPRTGDDVDFMGVSCRSTSSCVAVGETDVNDPHPGQAAVALWNGRVWSATLAPQPAGAAGGELTGVSCVSTTSCVAIGQYFGSASAGASAPFAETWNGTAWTVEAVPVPAGTSYASLLSVSCTSWTACIAVGQQGVSGGQQPLVELWNGKTWTHGDPVVPGGAGGYLAGVSCAGPTSCLAVGAQWSAGFTAYSPVAETWNGTTWSLDTPPEVAGTVAALESVSCLADGSCTAFGSYATGAASGLPLAERTSLPA